MGSAKRSPEELLRHLKENGTKLLVNLESQEPVVDKPIWFDALKFLRAKEMVEKYFIGIQYSSFTGLLMILQLPDGLEPLLATGNSKDIPSLHLRYLNTVLHVNSWYEDDVFDPSTKGYKSIRQVRSMHKRIQSTMNDRFTVSDADGQPRKWLNQYDMAITQFSFIGLAMVHPERTAMIAASHEELELINYYWRVLGFLMGIDDQYNACQFDKYEDIYQFNKLIFEQEFKEKFNKYPCQKGLEMSQSICVALHYYLPLLTFNHLAKWWQDCFLFNGYEPKPLNMREKIIDMWQQFAFNHLFKNETLMKLFNKLHRKRFAQHLKNRDKEYERLKSFYKGKQPTFYSDREDYFGNRSALTDGELKGEAQTIQNAAPCKTVAINSCPFGYGSLAQEPQALPTA